MTVNANGTFSYSPTANYFGTDSFTYRVNDGELDSEIAMVNLTVTAVNDAPVASDVTVTTLEDNSATINLVALDADNTPATLQFVIQNKPANGTLTANADGTYSYTPAANFHGADSFTYTVTDGDLVSNTATVRITVTSVNDAPVLPPARNLRVNEDSSIVIDPLAGTTDADGDTLAARIVAGPVNGTLTLNTDGSFSYSPTANYYGTDSFIYRVNDGELDSEIAMVNLTVTAVNDAPVASDVTVTTLEDNAVTINLIAADADNTPATLVFVIQSAPQNGTLTANEDGTFTYSPAANFNGADSFTYTVTDGDLVSNTATVRITVIAVNDAPTLGNQTLIVAEDNVLTGNLLATAADIDSTALTARIIAGPANGTLTLNANGTFSYQGANDYFGTDSFTYKVNDGDLDAEIATVSLTVTAINDAPVASDVTVTTAEDNSVTINLIAADADNTKATLVFAVLTQPANGSLTRNTDGSYSYTPAADFFGQDSFTYTATDGELVSNTATVRINVTAVNDAPVLPPARSLAVNEESQIVIDPLAGALDADGDTLTARIIAAPLHGTITVSTDGTYSYSPAANYFGADSFTYRVNDGSADSEIATVSITVAAVNDAPVASDVTVSTPEDTPATITLIASDVDTASGNLQFVIQNQPTNGTLTQNPDGSYQFTPAANFNGADSFTYTVTDGDLVSNTATVRINVTAVNDAPVLPPARNLSAREDSQIVIDPLAGALDADGDTLTARIIAGPVNGTLTLNTDGSFSYSPAANYFGADGFTYSVSDGGLESEIATVTINVAAVNDAPVASDVTVTTLEDNSVTINLVASDADNTPATLAFVIQTAPQNGTLTANADGTYSYSPAANFNGFDSFTYTVTDGELVSNVAMVRITVASVNDAPVLPPARNVSAREDSQIVIDPLAGATDADGDTLTARIIAAPLHGTITVSADGTFSYSPAANYFGADSFTYRVNDGSADSEIATVSITVAAVNDAPVASDVTVSTPEDTPATITLIASDVDTASGNLQFVIQNQPTNGTLTQNPDGSYQYTPTANFNGSDSFTYTVTDGDLVSNTATVRITVASVNDAPVAQDLVISLLEDGSVIVNLSNLGQDADGDTLTITPANPAQGSLVREANGSYRYTPVANYNGSDSFSYTVSDGKASASATVRLNVTAVNDAPVATADSATVIQGSSVTLNVLANDDDVDTDIDSQISSLRPIIVTQPARGTVVVNANGTVTYTPAATYSGADSFTYSVSDGRAQSEPVTVSLTVTPNNRAPVFTSTPPSTITLGAGSGTGAGSNTDSVFLPANSNGNSGSQITANFKLTERNAGYANEVGYYRVDDASGRIGNLRPSDAGYAAAALAASRAVSLFGGGYDVADKASAKLAAGQHVGFYLIQNATLANWRSKNSTNALPTGSQTQQQKPLAFFSWPAANPDGFDHLQASFAGNNGSGLLTLKWEDLTGGGDKDFNDVVFTATGLRAVSSGTTTTTTTTTSTSTIFTYDADANDPDGDTLTYSLAQAPQGAAINSQTGLINWTASTPGTYSFSVAASDGKGGTTSQTFTLTVKNAPAPNSLPVAGNDSATVDEDTTARINVLANDTDADGNPLTATVVTGPQNGTLTKNADGSFSYTPKKDWFGTDSFTYRANDGVDGTGQSNLATVTLTVKPVNDAPKAQNANYTVNKDGSIKIDLRGLASDVDNDCLTIHINNPSKGTLTKNRDGTYTYRPKRGYIGLDSFSYTVSDGKATTTGTISLNVGQGSGAGVHCPPSNSNRANSASSSSIVVSSSAASSSSSTSNTSGNPIQYVVVNSGASNTSSSSSYSNTTSSAPLAINWQATSSSSSNSSTASATSNWLSQLLRSTSDDDNESLANSTGLRVKL